MDKGVPAMVPLDFHYARKACCVQRVGYRKGFKPFLKYTKGFGFSFLFLFFSLPVEEAEAVEEEASPDRRSVCPVRFREGPGPSTHQASVSGKPGVQEGVRPRSVITYKRNRMVRTRSAQASPFPLRHSFMSLRPGELSPAHLIRTSC